MAHNRNLRRANSKTARTRVSDPGYPRSASPFAESLIDAYELGAGHPVPGFIARQETVVIANAR